MNKIEQFLFDIVGLLIPGFIAMVLPILLISIICDSNCLNNFYDLFDKFREILTKESKWIILATLLTFWYLVGHTVKIFSVRYYNLMQIIFDKNLNPKFEKIRQGFCHFFNKEICSKSNVFLDYFFLLARIIIKISEEFRKILSTAFVFQTQGYDEANEKIYDLVISELKNKHGININKKTNVRKLDYSIYKLSQIIQDTDNIKTLAHTFLAKYNFYRSLAFIFFMNFCFTIYLLFNKAISDLNIFYCILLILITFCYTFHEKYKRYWSLSGNESLMGIYYYLCLKNGSFKNNLIKLE